MIKKSDLKHVAHGKWDGEISPLWWQWLFCIANPHSSAMQRQANRLSGLKAGPGKGQRVRFYLLITYFFYLWRNLGLHLLGIIWAAQLCVSLPPNSLDFTQLTCLKQSITALNYWKYYNYYGNILWNTHFYMLAFREFEGIIFDNIWAKLKDSRK